jgi:hypothetical protein
MVHPRHVDMKVRNASKHPCQQIMHRLSAVVTSVPNFPAFNRFRRLCREIYRTRSLLHLRKSIDRRNMDIKRPRDIRD